MALSAENGQRYSRQLRFEPLGAEGQERILKARVAVIGCGALGSAIAEIMVRAGVGYVRLVDRDFVDTSNLPRQSLFDEDDVAAIRPKAVAAARKLRRINSASVVQPMVAQVSAGNIERLIDGVDLVMDGTDNFPTRYLVNDAAVKQGRPWIFGAALAAQGMAMVIRPGVTPCLRCVLDEPPPAGSVPSCDQAGVLASTVHVVAAVQCAEAMKWLSGNVEALERRLVDFDLWEGRFDYRGVAGLRGRGHCPTCEGRRFDYLDARLEPPEQLAGRDGVHVLPEAGAEPPYLPYCAARVRSGGVEATLSEHVLRFRSEDCTVTLFADGRAIVQGTSDAALARRIVRGATGRE